MMMTLLFLACFSAADEDLPGKKPPLTNAERKELAERVCNAAKKAVAAGDVSRTEFSLGRDAQRFEDVNRLGMVLIGFRVGIGPFVDRMTVQAVEPIYLNQRGVEIPGPKHGKEKLGVAKRGRANAPESEILRAKPGYAVGAVLLHTSVGIDGMRVVFMRIDGEKLNPADAYESKWVGTVGQGVPKTVGGAGALIVGFCGIEVGKDLQQIGFVFLGKKTPTKPPDEERPAAVAPPKQMKPAAPPVKKAARAWAKEPTTREIKMTVRHPLWKWEERYRHSRVGDNVQYDYPDERVSRVQEVVEVGERFVVIRERVMPINDVKLVLLKFEGSDDKPPSRPTPEETTVDVQGKKLSCKRYVYPPSDPSSGTGLQEVYSDDVPLDGLVGRLGGKGNAYLRRFSRGRE
jgi:hypothetical protein